MEKLETTLKALKQEVNIIGRVHTIDLIEDEDKNGNERIRGYVSILVKEKLKDEVREHVIRVNVYSRKFTNAGKESGLYKGYKTVLDEYKSIAETGSEKEADLVHVNGSISLNEYITEDGKHIQDNRISGRFFNRITPEKAKELKGPKATAVVEMVVDKFKDELDSEGLPTGNVIVKGYTVDFFGDLRENSKPIIPIEAWVKEGMADKLQELYEEGSTGKLTLKINNYAKEVEEDDINEIEDDMGSFGEAEDLSDVAKSFVNNLEIIGGRAPYDNGKAYTEEQKEEAKQWREKAIASLEESYIPDDKIGFDEPKEKKTENKPEEKKVELEKDDLPDFNDEDFDF